jgi:lysophospholipase L1-like esterase
METKRVVLNLDTSRLKFTSPDRYPILAWSVNKGPLQTHQLAAGESALTLSESITNPVIDLFIKGISPFEDRFHGDVPANAVTLTGFTVSPKCRIVSPPAAPLWLNLGDSILSGDAAGYTANQGRPPDDRWAASDDARASYGYLLAKHYGYAESRLAFGGYAWSGGGGNNPQVADLVDQLTSTRSRLTDGKLQPCPKVVLINLGENGAPNVETVSAALSKLRERTSATTRIFVMVPVSGNARAEITAAVKTYLSNSKDPQTQLIDLGSTSFETADGQHPTAAGHQSIYEAARPHFDRILQGR